MGGTSRALEFGQIRTADGFPEEIMAKKRDMRLKIVIDKTTSPRTKIFGTRFRMTFNLEKYLRRGELFQDPKTDLAEGLDLAKRIFEIPGVQAMVIDQFDVYVTIGRAFDWVEDELELDIHRAIRLYLETENMMEDISGKNIGKKQDPGQEK